MAGQLSKYSHIECAVLCFAFAMFTLRSSVKHNSRDLVNIVVLHNYDDLNEKLSKLTENACIHLFCCYQFTQWNFVSKSLLLLMFAVAICTIFRFYHNWLFTFVCELLFPCEIIQMQWTKLIETSDEVSKHWNRFSNRTVPNRKISFQKRVCQ